MTTITTRWTPDTCSSPPCIFEYTWDSETNESERVHTLSTVIQKCSDHAALTNANCYSTVLDENPKKSRSIETVLANGPAVLYDIKDGVRQLKETVRFQFSWSGVIPNRILTITFPGISLTTNQRNTIQNALNTRFGVGKVILA
jgi:hypothetical protein